MSDRRLILGVIMVAAMLSNGSRAFSQAWNLQSAYKIKNTVVRAKSVVDRAIASVPHGLENDAVALPIYVQASSTLGQAGDHINQAIAAFLAANFQLFTFKYSVACAKGGVGRSQISRANLAALIPPPGNLAVFGPEITEVINELQLLRAPIAAGGAGCP